jgi:hypothetical protein
MTPGQNRGKSSGLRRDQANESRRASKRPYVRPSISRQDLEHVVKGQTGPRLDGASGRIGKSQGG